MASFLPASQSMLRARSVLASQSTGVMPLLVRGITTHAARASVATKHAPSAREVVARRSVHKATTARPSTTPMRPDENLEMLNKQRALRPSSPHFTIYQPQLTWIGSIVQRVTGSGISGILYVYAIAYAAAPLVGLTDLLSSASLVSFVASAPFALKLLIKAPLAASISYHTWNGIRHLAWDYGYCLSLKGAYKSGYTVIGATVLSTIGLCLL